VDIIKNPFGLIKAEVGMTGYFHLRRRAAMYALKIAAAGYFPGNPFWFKLHQNTSR
jgi:hypothetical protein